MKTNLPFALLTLSLFACSTSSLEDVDTDEGEDALVTTTIGAISVSSRSGFIGLPSSGCQAGVGTWRVEFAPKKLTGSVCVSGTLQSIERELSPSEFQEVRTAVRRIRPAVIPGACPMDVPSQLLDVERVSKPNAKAVVEKYVDARSSCNTSGRKAATNIGQLVQLLQNVSAVAAPLFDATVTNVTIDRTAGLYAGGGPLDQCNLPAAKYSIDITKGSIERNVCVRRSTSFPVYNSMDTASGKLSAKDLLTLKSKLTALEEQLSPETHCAPGRAVTAVSFTRPSGTTRFVDEFSSCASTDRQVASDAFEALIDFVASAKLL